MNYFDGIEGIEEFDWFSETDIPDDYESIVDLKNKIENENIYDEIDNQYEYGEIEDDILMWHYAEGLQPAMDSVFANVYKKICGAELDVNSKYIHDYIGRLGEEAVVVQSDISDIKNAKNNSSMLESKIKACFCENGTLIALVSNEAWENIRYGKETEFLDNGIRAMQIIGMRGDEIVINDCLDENGMGVLVPSKQFSQLQGILLEVYK